MLELSSGLLLGRVAGSSILPGSLESFLILTPGWFARNAMRSLQDSIRVATEFLKAFLGGVMQVFVWLLTVLIIPSSFGETPPPPVPPPSSLTLYYNRTSYKSVEASGPTCAEAKFDALNSFYQWAQNIPVRGTLVAPATIYPGTCSCGIGDNEIRHVSCLGSYEEELFYTVRSDNTESGFPHGATLDHYPSFAAVGTGLECEQATETARAKLYEQLEDQSVKYEFMDMPSPICSCEPMSDAIARCEVQVPAFYRDARL